MRSLFERFADAFRADLYKKWNMSSMQLAETEMGHGDTAQLYPPLRSEGIDGLADACSVDFDLIFEQLFGVNLAHM